MRQNYAISARCASCKVKIFYIIKMPDFVVLFGLNLKLGLGIMVSSVVKVRVMFMFQLVTTLQSCLQNKIHVLKTLPCNPGRKDCRRGEISG